MRFGRALFLSYASLTTIPIGFSTLSAYNFVRGDRDRARAHAFWAWTGWCAIPLALVMFAVTPVSLLTDPVDRTLIGRVQQIWAKCSLAPFLTVEVIRALPLQQQRNNNTNSNTKRNEIIVANHTSWLDPYILMALDDYPNIRFVSKQEIFLIPLVGWVMGLVGHIALNRTDRESGKQVLKQCSDMFAASKIQLPIVFFPEGSRPRVEAMGEFKIGAFKLSVDSGVPIRPISIYGTRQAMAPGMELQKFDIRHSTIFVTVHDVVLPEDVDGQQKDAIELRDQTRATIVDGLIKLQGKAV